MTSRLHLSFYDERSLTLIIVYNTDDIGSVVGFAGGVGGRGMCKFGKPLVATAQESASHSAAYGQMY